ncbi:MAG TPA: hypothetical protein VK922_17395 [Gemmatimonadaceae bacterium]|nr:hypothetical protein [Gemmatimonadaceae bacterium]
MRGVESNGHDAPLATMPLHRSICWRPLGDSYFLLAAVLGDQRTHYPLFITQQALMEVEEQRLAIEDEYPVVGLLGGVLARSPERGFLYPTITRVVPIRRVEAGEEGRQAFRGALHRARVHLATCGEEVVGWYRSRAAVGRRMIAGDERHMLEHFPKPWQTTLIISPDCHGAFFRYKLEAERSFMVPFYELVDEETPVAVDASVLPFLGYSARDRAAYPETAPIELEDALRIESEEELGPLGRRFLRQLRRALLGDAG